MENNSANSKQTNPQKENAEKSILQYFLDVWNSKPSTNN
ncbi:hypothetical protein BREVNS_0494 [Brevinematales bacterium NS]|nr:hypothetical protein BREVNS_0494 [Brevinematales bacterium NS]